MSKDTIVTTVSIEGVPSGTTAAQWVALAGCESDFDEKADVVDTNGRRSIGAWQINLGPDGTRNGKNRDELKNPVTNFRVAKQIFSEQGWRAWFNCTNGGKGPTVSAADKRAADEGPVGPGPGGGIGDIVSDAVGNPLEGIEGLTDALGKFFTFITDPNTFKRLGFVLAGIGLVFVGANIIARPVVKDISSIVQSVKP